VSNALKRTIPCRRRIHCSRPTAAGLASSGRTRPFFLCSRPSHRGFDISRLCKALHSPWVGDKGGWYDAKSKPEEIQADVEQARQRIEGATRDGQFSLRKHAEGFGRAALEAGDIAVAIDNLDAGGVLESPDVVGVLRAKLVELKESPKAEDKIKLRKASEKLLAIQTRRQATEGK